MNQLARPLPNIGTAALPATYERAKSALAACNQIDECKDWADKAAALASYAKQADDDSLQKLALRIQARAIRRCGELLQTFQSPGARTDKPSGDAPTRLTQRQAADAAGLSKDQEVTAVRVANVPAADFEAALEGDDPPTVTHLAELGTKSQPKVAEKFAEATHVLGVLYTFATFCAEHEPAAIATALYPHECKSARRHVATVEAWLAAFIQAIKED
jgi:hypothetical protein